MAVIFAILEWHHFINFESGSLTPTSVAIILPLGSLAAQRLALAGQHASSSDITSYPSSSGAAVYHGRYKSTRGSGSGSRTPLKAGSLFSTTTNGSTAAGNNNNNNNSSSSTARDILDPIDLELRQIDGYLQPKDALTRAEAGESGQFHK